MAWIITAVSAGAAALGGWGSVATIATGAVGAISASKSGSRAQQAAEDAGKEELAFVQQQYDDWKDTYGDVEKNLSEYYGAITPDYIETQGLQAFEEEKDLALTSIRENLSQRGIATSGVAAQAEIQAELGSAATRAKIRADAPMKAASEKSKFLQIGLGQDPAGDVQQVLSGQAGKAFNLAGEARSQADTAVASAVEVGLDAFTQYTDKKKQVGDSS